MVKARRSKKRIAYSVPLSQANCPHPQPLSRKRERGEICKNPVINPSGPTPQHDGVAHCIMWSRKRLDIGWSDLGFGFRRVCFPPDRGAAARRVEAVWPSAENMLACLSVRSGFDLLLDALDLPRGSEAIVSAVTIPDMAQFSNATASRLCRSMSIGGAWRQPRAAWRSAVTPATRLILAAHLFGGRTEMTPLVDFANERRLLLVEDCAQAFDGVAYEGHPWADVSMFSFGTIKNNTALGGAVLRVRDGRLLSRMRTFRRRIPCNRRWAYFQRLAKCAALKMLASRPICGLFARTCRATGRNYDRLVNRSARGFPGGDFFTQIRRQPSAPLLAVLERRLRRYDFRRAERQAARGRELASLLMRRGVSCPGAEVSPHTYWVFPILAERPDRLLERLSRAGFDATQGQSLCVVRSGAETPKAEAPEAEMLLARVVFLPFYPEMPMSELHRMAGVVSAVVQE